MISLSQQTRARSLPIPLPGDDPGDEPCANDVSQGSPINDWSGRLVTMRTINASEFKAQCLAILDEIARSGESIVITKRGKPVARLLPPIPEEGYPQHRLRGSGHIAGDVIAPPLPGDAWEAARAMVEPGDAE